MRGRRSAGTRGPAVLVATTALAYGVAWRFVTRPMGDSGQYRADGITITQGWGEVTDRTPGYPLLLWATGSLRHETRLLFLVQLLFHAVSVLLAVDIVRRLGLNLRAQAAVAVLLVTLPTMVPVVYAGSEALTQVLVVASVWCFTRWVVDQQGGWLWAIGAAAAAVTWVRPSYAVLFAPLAAGAVLTDRTGSWSGAARRAAPVALPALAAIGLLMSINAVRFDAPGLTPLTGWYLSSRTSTFVQELPDSYEPGRSILVEERDRQLLLGDEVDAPNYAFAVRDQLGEAMNMDRTELDRWMLRANLRLIATHPLEYQDAVGRAAVRYVAIDSQRATQAMGRPATWGLMMIHLGLQIAFVGQLVLVPGLLWVRRRWLPEVPVLATALAVCAAVAFVAVTTETGTSRLRAPTDPLLAVILVSGWALVARERAERRQATTDPSLP